LDRARQRSAARSYPDYLAAAQPAFEKFGAKFIVRGGHWAIATSGRRAVNVCAPDIY
jgi:uncharacterized protein (DUF1330 family)